MKEKNNYEKNENTSIKNEPVILYNSHENVDNNKSDVKTKETEGKK